jgi:complement C1q subcomponent subunit C
MPGLPGAPGKDGHDGLPGPKGEPGKSAVGLGSGGQGSPLTLGIGSMAWKQAMQSPSLMAALAPLSSEPRLQASPKLT